MLLQKESQSNIQVLHNQKVRGKSGVDHQIDVSWEFRQAGVTHRVIVECKHYVSTVELGHVRNFHSVVEDIGDARGLMVTTVGYQEGAIDFAEHHRIGLKILRSPNDSDWENRIKNIQVNFNIRMLSVEHPVKIELGELVASDKEHANRLKGAQLQDPSISSAFDSAGLVKEKDFKDWLCRQLPVAEQSPGGPYEQLLELSHTYFKLVLGDGSLDLVEVKRVCVEYYVIGMREEMMIMANEIVELF